ncbi:hypothetical protein FOG51_04010 [Hanseniaspora uvarum]|uniref:Transcription initiation factor IIA subunit 2 n=1 Tax=Hanseniaspora uvarum TaxID=29833 RepID=A0A1E5S1F9_HANUV|nr:hypothetical protein FOG48_02774 [Hanseniaspora uvarum]KAF0271132.1 hypothetical protein FOG51_04010 [Hanseniaspora uvarum]KAF0275294.1 hypothetical protein FOG50_03853 [Hanseniaspora uvarum]KKA02628.1 Transcription initiation factor IIA subunit 2 [Hanseniaspora uvarum DSM 2768]OEJ92855.1 Transcription initiation factor IIA subunit 2 [Hanseniaspora uvarum]
MSAIQQYYELYRRSTIGITLVESLDNLITEGKIEPQLAIMILNSFDKSINNNLKEMNVNNTIGKQTASANANNNKVTIQGDLHTYRFCDEVWTLIIKNCLLKLENGNLRSEEITADTTENPDLELKCDKLRIVACSAKKQGE